MPQNRTTNYCLKCGKAYKDKHHLKKCYPDKSTSDIDKIHLDERERVKEFTDKRIIMEFDLRAVMTECNIPLKIYDNVSNVLTRYGHTIFASLDRNIAFPPSASTSDRVMSHLPMTRASVQNLECVDDVGTCMSGETEVDPGDDDSSVYIEETEDTTDETITVPPAKSKRYRAGVRYNYEHDTVRRDLKEAGLYQEIPLTDPFLEGFKKYLTSTLQITNADMNLQKVTKVSRYMFFFMNKTDPTSSPPTQIKLESFVHRDKCGDYFSALEKCGMRAVGVKNNIIAMKHFTEYIMWCANITDEEMRTVKNFASSLKPHNAGAQKKTVREQAAKNVAHMIDPLARPVSLTTVQMAYKRPDIIADVNRVIKQAKELNAMRRVTEPLVKVKDSDHHLVTRYLAGAVFQLGHFQRPGVPSKMTIEEYLKVVDIDEDNHMIAVKNHKTATSYPACVVLNGSEMNMMKDYWSFIRGPMPDDLAPAVSRFFRNPVGNGIDNMNKELTRLQTRYGIVKQTSEGGKRTYTSSDARKSLEVANREHYRGNADAQKNVSDYLAHSRDVAMKHYSKKKHEDVVMARNSILKLTNSDGGPSSDPTPDAAQPEQDALASETEVSDECTSVTSGVSPVSAECCQSEYKDAFCLAFPTKSGNTVPSLRDVKSVLCKEGLDPLLTEKFAKRYIARWRIDNESSQVQEHLNTISATERPSNTADALKLLSYLGCSRVRASTVVSMAKKLPVTESRIEQKAKRQREVEANDEWLPSRIEDQQWPGLMVYSTDDMGKGVKTSKPFKRGDIICDYNGLKLKGLDARNYIRKASKDINIDTSYMYQFKCSDVACVVDSLDDKYSHMIGRNINHSRNPNLISKPKLICGNPSLLFIADMDIPAGTELRFDYGDRSSSVPEWLKDKRTQPSSSARPDKRSIRNVTGSENKGGPYKKSKPDRRKDR